MKLFTLRRILAGGLLLLIIVLGAATWLLNSEYLRHKVAFWVRQKLTANSDLVLAPFEVKLSPWRDFPHLTASLLNVQFTDTTARQPVSVLLIGRADARLDLSDLWHRKVRVTRLTINDVEFHQQVDSLGRRWGLHARERRTGPGKAPALNFMIDSVLVNNFRITTRNQFLHNGLQASVQHARLSARLRAGRLHVQGRLAGQLNYLRNSSSSLFTNEPVRVWVNYNYAFRERQGTFVHTRALLHGDTIRVGGTHTSTARGTELALRFVGTQPLMAVLRTALPPNLQAYLAGAVSPSKASLRYTITGLAGPKTAPRNVLTFGLRNASLRWPDATRRINSWDLLATYDNGPAHRRHTASLTLQRCRIYSSAGQLDLALRLTDFTKPFIDGRLQGRTELPELAALFAPGLWRARHGVAAIDVHMRGLLRPPAGRQTMMQVGHRLLVRGSITLRNASFVLLDRQADMSQLNVRIGLQDSTWQLTNASGLLDKMRFQASATTTNLMPYLTGQRASTAISGQFAVDELHIGRLRQLFRPVVTRTIVTGRAGRRKRRIVSVATLGNALLPPGLHLNVSLRCGRLILPADTVRDLAVNVRHDGHRVQLSNIAGRVWGGTVSGQATWPTDTTNTVAPIDFQLGVHFDTVNYRHLITLLTRPPQHADSANKLVGGPRRRPKTAGALALRELLFASNGQIACDINTVELPASENLQNLHFRLVKNGNDLLMPRLDFTTSRSGVGHASASATVRDARLTAGDVDVSFHYKTLDVQQLLLLIASLNPSAHDVTPDVADDDDEDDEHEEILDARARRAARAEARTARRAQRGLLPRQGSVLNNGQLSAVVRVEADQVKYAALAGRQFHLVSRLYEGSARVEDCSLLALGGRIDLHGRLRTDAGRLHHPLRVQARVQDIQLSELFTTLSLMNIKALSGSNIVGTMRATADLRTDLNETFLPVLNETLGVLKTDIRSLELLNVEALGQALKFMKDSRTSHLYFEPVSSQFVLDRGRLLIPDLALNSNLSDLAISGNYFLDGRADLYIGFSPTQTLFGNNEKRIERIRNGETVSRRPRKLTYINLRRAGPGERYAVRLFKKGEQRQQQLGLLRQAHQFLLTQRLDTTLLAPSGTAVRSP